MRGVALIRRRFAPLPVAVFAVVAVAAFHHSCSGTNGQPAGMASLSGEETPRAALSGRAIVVDGDTVSIIGQNARIRLFGIDAPEKAQACRDAAGRLYQCGTRATAHLARLIGRDGVVVCAVRDVDRYQRVVAECETPAGVSLNREMVRAGWAVDFVRYSAGRYAAEQRDAETARRGLWAGSFDDPAQWR